MNILSTHKKTIEFTKDSNLSLQGNCIIGLDADFELGKLLNFVKENKKKKITAIISAGGINDKFTFYLNESFTSENEIVIRRGDYLSERTLGNRCDKSSMDINRNLIEQMQNNSSILKVEFREAENNE